MEDMRIAPNFTLKEATRTRKTEYLQANRDHGRKHLAKIVLLGNYLLQPIREHLDYPMITHSWSRAPALNEVTPGSSDISQHLLCEAWDGNLPGYNTRGDTLVTWRLIHKFLTERKLMWGQLILETAKRDYGRVSWIHLSLGYPFRSLDRCGEVLTMQDGTYKLICRYTFPEWELNPRRNP